jgi:6-phosphofructokinase 2
MKIITLTINPSIDMSASAKQIIAEKKIRCSNPVYEPGGGGINVARAIKNLGGESVAFYTCGGNNGIHFKSLIEASGIKHHPIQIEDNTRENITISEESSERQFRFVMPGPVLKKQEWENILEELISCKEKPEFIVASGSLPAEMPKDFYAEVAKIGKSIGAKVIVDTSGEALKHAIDAGVYMIKPNIGEMKQLMHEDFLNENQLEEAAKEMIKEGKVEVVFVSLGSAGAHVVTKEISEHLRAPTVPVKSKVGAGDSTVAGVTLHLSRGNSVHDSVLYGIACGAAAVMTPGSELCRKNDAERLYKQIKKLN